MYSYPFIGELRLTNFISIVIYLSHVVELTKFKWNVTVYTSTVGVMTAPLLSILSPSTVKNTRCVSTLYSFISTAIRIYIASLFDGFSLRSMKWMVSDPDFVWGKTSLAKRSISFEQHCIHIFRFWTKFQSRIFLCFSYDFINYRIYCPKSVCRTVWLPLDYCVIHS